MMVFIVWDGKGGVLYDGRSWPMARAALDHAFEKDDGVPRLEVLPEWDPQM